MRIFAIILIPLLSLFFLFGCSTDDGSSLTGGDIVPDVDAPTVSIDSYFGGGDLSISGTVQLPDSASAARSIMFGINKTSFDPYPFSEFDATQVTTTSKYVNYVVNGLSTGDYTLRMQVDQSGDLEYGTTGDFDGYYNGTVSAPIQSSGSATTITLSESMSNVDFGIGTLD